MSLARSAIQPLRTVSHTRYYAFSIASLPGCRLCNARHYSAQQESLQREVDSEQHGLANSASSSKNLYHEAETERASFGSLLLPDDIESKPGLSALDELNPFNNNSKFTTSYAKSNSPLNPFDVWKKTLDRVKQSFTARQLEDMSVEANLPTSILKLYRKKRTNMTKTIRAKALMTHRFKMEDPELQAEQEAARAKKTQKSKSIEFLISQIALLLLVLRGQSDLQRLLQLNRVKVRPSKREGEDNFALHIQGTEQGIEIVREWIYSFVDKIQSAFFPLSSLSVSQEFIQAPDEHRLRSISRLSRSIVSLDDQGSNVTIYSVDDASLEAAQSLLVQSLHDDRQAYKRQIYSYASAPIPSDTFASVPTYGFIPYVASSPISWLFSPGPTTNLFRIARQDVINADEKVFSEEDDLDKPSLKSLKSIETYDKAKAASLNDNVFALLQDKVQIQNKSSGSWTFTAEFGHLLFNNHDQASESKVLSLITPPVPGTWPLEHGIDWLRNSIQRDVLSAPSFNPILPPLAAGLDAGTVPSQFTTQSAEDGDDANQSVEERINRSNQRWSENLSKFGFHLQTNNSHKLHQIVNLNTPRFAEDLVITFTGGKADLEIRLRETTNGVSSSGMAFHEAKWVQKTNADILVPEASVDLRLGAIYSDEVKESALLEDAGLREYLEEQRDRGNKISTEETPEVEERRATLPRTAIVQDEELFLISAKQICRWEWDILDKKIASFQGKFVLERGAQSDEGENQPAFKVEFKVGEVQSAGIETEAAEIDENVDSIEDGSSEQDEEKVEEGLYQTASEHDTRQVPSWKITRQFVNMFLAKGYRALRG